MTEAELKLHHSITLQSPPVEKPQLPYGAEEGTEAQGDSKAKSNNETT